MICDWPFLKVVICEKAKFYSVTVVFVVIFETKI